MGQGVLPEAGIIQKALSAQEERNDFYLVGGAWNLYSHDDLLEFKIVNNVFFPLSTNAELGYRYIDDFDQTFTFIGKNNRIIGTLGLDADLEKMDVMMKRAACSFYDLYVKNSSGRLLLTGDVIEIDMGDFFHSGTDFENVEFEVKSNTNPAVLNYTISDKKFIVQRGTIKGVSDISLIGRVKGKEIYVQTDIKIINPTELHEDFEIEDLRDSEIGWTHSGASQWQVTDEESYFGSKSLRSGTIDIYERSAVTVELHLAEPGIIIFAYKTSTRPYYDRFRFYFDGVDMSAPESPNYWSGENDWIVKSYSVRAGIRNFSWAYEKGPYPPYNRDIVWIDMIVLPDKHNVKESITPPKDIAVQAYPNPFNPSTRINFELNRSQKVSLMIFDVKGRLVSEIYDGELPKGDHSFSFDGSSLSGGMYYSVLSHGDNITVSKLILAK